jgi:hypothetical protein
MEGLDVRKRIDEMPYPDEYKYDKKQAILMNKILKDSKTFESAAQPNYTQLNFPYDQKYINAKPVGKIQKLPDGGKEMIGVHNDKSCSMNAAQIYTMRNKPSIVNVKESKYINDLSYKITTGNTVLSGFYSKIDDIAQTLTGGATANIELTGFLLPNNGGKDGTIVPSSDFIVGGRTFGVWLYLHPNMSTYDNAAIHYTNGTRDTTKNSKATYVILKNAYIPIVIRYVAKSATDLRLAQGMNMPFTLKSGNNVITYSVNVSADGGTGATQIPIYYNLQKNTGKCTIYDTSVKTVDTNLFENASNYGDYMVTMIESIALDPNNNILFVGLSETGILKQYFMDATGKYDSSPVGDIQSKRGRIQSGNNNYKLLIDESGKIIIKYRNGIMYNRNITNFSKSNLVTNVEWSKKQGHLNSINSANQMSDLGIKAPSMRITADSPLYSANYKLKMSLEKDGAAQYLRIFKTVNNTNALFSVNPDFKMGKLFLADKNDMSKKMFLNNKPEYKKFHGYTNYGEYHPPIIPDASGFTVFDRKRIGECKEYAKKNNRRHYYHVVMDNNTDKCIIPNAEKDIEGPVFLPKQSKSGIKSSTLYVENKSITSGNIEMDKKMKLNKYSYENKAYENKAFSDFNLANVEWSPDVSLPKEFVTYGSTNRYVNNAVGVKSTDNVSGTATVDMIREPFQTTIQNRTIGQIDNYTRPLFSSYLDKQNKVNKNVADISKNIEDINAKYKIQSDKVAETNNIKNHKFYDFTNKNIVYSLNEDRSMVPALLKDQQTMIIEHNNLFIVSTITVTTLLISAIFMSSE